LFFFPETSSNSQLHSATDYLGFMEAELALAQAGLEHDEKLESVFHRNSQIHNLN